VTKGLLKNQSFIHADDAIEFTWHEDKAIKPKWRTLKPPLVDLIKKLMED